MATSFAVSLSQRDSKWAEMFRLQSSSDFSGSLDALNSLRPTDEKTILYKNLLAIQLDLCLDALNGIEPTEDARLSAQNIARNAASDSLKDIRIDALFLMFDLFPDSRKEVFLELASLEETMGGHTLRRWVHRKGQSFVQLGQLHEAFDLWLPLVTGEPLHPEDEDDSLVVLLVDFGRLCSQLGKYSDAVEVYNQAVCVSKTPYNLGVSLIRLSNALERVARPAQADKRRIEYFALIRRDHPTHCALCSGIFHKEPKFLIPCCKTVVHSECLRQEVSDYPEPENECPFCKVKFLISDVADPTSVTARKYKRHKKSSRGGVVDAQVLGESVAETAPEEDSK